MRETMRDAQDREGPPVMERTQRVSSRALVGSMVAIIIIFVVSLLVLMETSTYHTWGGMLVGPVLVLITLPILSRQAAREGDRSLFWLLVAALFVKLGGAFAFHFVAYDVYDRVADAVGYHGWGVDISEQFRSGDYDPDLEPITGINFIRLFTGIFYTVIGPTRLGGYLFFSWLGFMGLFFFYRAFVVAVPEGRARTYARFLFFLPSLAFWPSSIGKEAWMMLALGISAFGAARILSGRTWRGLIVAGFGMWLGALVRPHIAGLVGVALALSYILRRPREDLRQFAPVVKAISVVALAVVAAVTVVRAEKFLSEHGVETERGVAGVQQSIRSSTSIGGSVFVPSLLQSPMQAPRAVVTVLFRPLPHEAHNAQAFLASLESLFLLLFTLVRIPWGFAALGGMRRQPYVGFALAYSAMFIVAFSAFANFGLLARERVQVLPFYVLFLCIPPRPKEPVPVLADDPLAQARAAR